MRAVWRKTKSVLCRPAATVLLLAYLVVNAFLQPGYRNGWDRTTVGVFCSELRGQTRPTCCVMPRDYFALPEQGGGWRVLETNRFEDANFPLAGEVLVDRTDIHQAFGFWSLVWARHEHRVSVVLYSAGPVLTFQQRLDLLAAIDSKWPGEFPSSTRTVDAAGGRTTRRVLWGGVTNDASVLVAAVMLAVSLRWLPTLWRRPRPGFCAACGYDLRGLSGSICPECGRNVKTT